MPERPLLPTQAEPEPHHITTSQRMASTLIAAIEESIKGFLNTTIEIIILSLSNQSYDIFSDTSHNTDSEYRSCTDFDVTTGTVQLKMGDNFVFSIAHELKHAYQFEIGEYNITKIFAAQFYDLSDELEAYKRGFLFGGPNYPTIESLPDIYNGLKTGPIGFSNVFPLLINQPLILRGRINQLGDLFVGRYNGITYFTSGKK